MSAAVCRVGDTISGTCSVHGATTGTWPANSSIMTDGAIKLVLVGYSGTAACGHTFTATAGSPLLTIGGVQVHRIGDAISFSAGGTGVSVEATNPIAVLSV